MNDGTSSTGTPVFSIGNDGSTTIKSTSSTNSPFKITNNTLPTGGAITSGANAQTAFEVAANGQVFIGPQRVTSSAQANAILQVAGDLVVGNTSGTTGGIYVTQYFWADFVFDKNYKLTPLNEVENFYKKNHHLPNVPSEKEIRENGNNLAQTDVALLQKIEELTLYLVEQKKISEQQQKEIEELKALMKNNKK